MNIFSGIFFQPFEGFPVWCVFDAKGRPVYNAVPLKFIELLKLKFEECDSEFPIQFMVVRDKFKEKTFCTLSLCHPIHDVFSAKQGIEIATGRLKRLMGKGYATYKGKNMLGKRPSWVNVDYE